MAASDVFVEWYYYYFGDHFNNIVALYSTCVFSVIKKKKITQPAYFTAVVLWHGIKWGEMWITRMNFKKKKKTTKWSYTNSVDVYLPTNFDKFHFVSHTAFTP